jgi:DNA-binding winged helix-turn-helix (wHTH) protein
VPTRASQVCPRLEMLAGNTGIVRFDGRRIVLSPMQHAMLVALVEHLDAGVSYRELTERLWPDAQVEQQQLFYHRRQLEKALLGRPAEPAGELIETRDKWGFALRIPSSEISIVPAAPRRTRAA